MLVVACAAQAFRFPFIEPFERHFNESAYQKGVNFAYSGATAATRKTSPRFKNPTPKITSPEGMGGPGAADPNQAANREDGDCQRKAK